jgi:ATP-dependent DNA ligase
VEPWPVCPAGLTETAGRGRPAQAPLSLCRKLCRWRLRRRSLSPCSPAPDQSRRAATGAFEVKWDGFGAIVSTEGEPLRLPSRRGWRMAKLVPELSALPIAATLDGELVGAPGGRHSCAAQ